MGIGLSDILEGVKEALVVFHESINVVGTVNVKFCKGSVYHYGVWLHFQFEAGGRSGSHSEHHCCVTRA